MKMNREIVNISLNRDSVCMADDINDHREIVFVPADMTAKDFVRTVCFNYLKRGKQMITKQDEQDYPQIQNRIKPI